MQDGGTRKLGTKKETVERRQQKWASAAGRRTLFLKNMGWWLKKTQFMLFSQKQYNFTQKPLCKSLRRPSRDLMSAASCQSQPRGRVQYQQHLATWTYVCTVEKKVFLPSDSSSGQITSFEMIFSSKCRSSLTWHWLTRTSFPHLTASPGWHTGTGKKFREQVSGESFLFLC